MTMSRQKSAARSGGIPSFPRTNVLISALILISSISPVQAKPVSTEQKQTALTQNSYDVLIYGGTPAAITAALQVKRMQKTVAIVCPEANLGGLTTSGLGWTDSKDGRALGGIAREFYKSIYDHYNTESSDVWKSQTRQEYQNLNVQAQPGPAIDEKAGLQWTFEPRVAQSIFDKMISDAQIPVFKNESLNREEGGVSKDNSKITQMCTLSGKCYQAKQFIDAGYEGDLMAAANIQYKVGRDSRSEYGESNAGMFLQTTGTYAGIRPGAYDGINPYNNPNDSSSGLVHGLQDTVPDPLPSGWEGSADDLRLQSFNYRLCLTRNPANRIPFSKPANFNVSEYELLLRLLEKGEECGFTDQKMPNNKTDSNSKGPFSFDFIGGNFDAATRTTYSEASYEQRREIVQRHKDYQMGLLYTLTHSTRVPDHKRREFRKWGLAKDEFVENGNWPPQLYIREARRMQGMHVLTQQDVQNSAGYLGDAVVGMGSYSIDSHIVRRVVQDGKIFDEGGFYISNPRPYAVPYQSIVPKREDATNFLNPVTLSASHVAFGSVRMEPTYMVLGQSAGLAAVLAIEQGVDVQDVKRGSLMREMSKCQQKIGY